MISERLVTKGDHPLSSNWYIFRGFFLIDNVLNFVYGFGLIFCAIFFIAVDLRELTDLQNKLGIEFDDETINSIIKQFQDNLPKIEIISTATAAILFIEAGYFILKAIIGFRAHSAVSIACYQVWNIFTMIELMISIFFVFHIHGEFGAFFYILMCAFIPSILLLFLTLLMTRRIVSTLTEQKYKWTTCWFIHNGYFFP